MALWGPFIFYEHGGAGGICGGGGGGHEKKNGTKGGGGYQIKLIERGGGGVTYNNWLVGEIESGSTQKQMKKLNIISIS